MTGRNDPTDHLALADEIAFALAAILERNGELAAFLAGDRTFLVRRDGIAIFEEADVGAGTVPGSAAN